MASLNGISDFAKQAFQDNGTASSSRILSAICTFASIIWISHVVIKTHTIPDAVSIGGLTAFNTSHYIANRVTGIFGNQPK